MLGIYKVFDSAVSYSIVDVISMAKHVQHVSFQCQNIVSDLKLSTAYPVL